MRRAIILCLTAAFCVVALAACGHTSASQKQEAQAEAAKFEAKAKQCLPSKDGVPSLSPLHSKSGRKQFADCLVPPSQRVTFTKCAESAVIGHFNKVKIEAGLNACLEKVS